jgi:hypothetical protein
METARPEYSEASARARHCWFSVDRVARDPATTEWKRRARWHQSLWREARGLPVGANPYQGGVDAITMGSRLEFDFARRSGANFITPGALAAVRARLESPEQHQTLKEDRLWADLLSSMPMCFNLFGDLAGDPTRALDAVRAWWPDAPRGDVHVRFEHSPGRCDPTFLGNKSAFDVAFDIEAGAAGRGIVGVETKYHEDAKRETRRPKPATLARYVEVSERSGAFVDGWRERVVGTDLEQIWQDHLLLLSMLQHMSKRWTWGRFVLVYPSENHSFATASERYAALLRDAATFESRTLEDLLATPGALPSECASAFHERYLAVPRGSR